MQARVAIALPVRCGRLPLVCYVAFEYPDYPEYPWHPFLAGRKARRRRGSVWLWLSMGFVHSAVCRLELAGVRTNVQRLQQMLDAMEREVCRHRITPNAPAVPQ